MTDLQKHILMLLKEIDSICRENEIEYYLGAGTALGAARHQGFLPWDDDADIYMTDENWRKFYSVRDQIPRGREVISVEEDFSAGYTINRYVDIMTTRLYRYLCASPQDAGIIIDILVLDPVPDDPVAIREHIVDLTDYTDILTLAHRHTQQCPYPLHYEETVRACKNEGREAVLKKLRDRTVEKYRGTKGGVLIQRDAVFPHVWKEEFFGTPRYVPFEDTKLPVAERQYEQLCVAFDEDWMYIPQGAGRVLHQKEYNLNISNNNAFEDYLSLIDRKRVATLYEKRQHYGNLAGLLHRDQTKARFPITEAALVCYYNKLDTPLHEVEAMLEKGDDAGLDAYFRRYREVQCHRDLIGDVRETGWLRSRDPYYIHISDDFLYLFMRYCLRGENVFGKMNRILEGREADRAPTGKITELRTLLDSIRRSCTLMEKGSYEAVLSLAGPLSEKYPENLPLKRLTFAAAYYTASGDEIEELYGRLDGLAGQDAEKWLNDETGGGDPRTGPDSVLLSILADIELKKGNRERALTYFDVICRTSSHGLVLLYVYNTTKDLAGDPAALRLHRDAGRRMGIVYEDEPEEAPEEPVFERELNDHQAVLLKLLHEIDDLCGEHGIRYYLAGKSALAAVRSGGFEENMTNLHLMMDGVNIRKFMDVFHQAGRPDRYLESMLNNEDFPTTAAFYGDLDTVDLMTWTWHDYRNLGIHATIHLLRKRERSRAEARRNIITENVWTFRDAPRMEGMPQRLYRLAGRLIGKKARKRLAGKLFDNYTKNADRPAGKYFVRASKRKKRVYFDRKFFSGVEMVPFEDLRVPLPKDPEGYLKARFGKNWMKVKTKGNVIPAQHLVYTEISCEELYRELDRRGVDLDKIWELRKRYEKAEWEYKAVNEEVHKVWDRLFFAGDRLNLWEYYEPKKEELRGLYEREDWSGLLAALDEYVELARTYSAKGLGLCFDKDIFGFLEAALKNSGDKELTKLGEGLRDKVPAQHWQPIRIRTFDGRPDEKYRAD